MEIKLGIIEDNDILRGNYNDFFRSSVEFDVLFALADWKLLFQLNSSKQPDIILLDLMLPSGNSVNYIHKIKQLFPVSKIIVLSAVSEIEMSQMAFANGVTGFLLKSSSLQYIKESLLKTYEGGVAMSPMIASHMLEKKSNSFSDRLNELLTKREMELCRLVVTGMANKMIASSMNVTFFTINQHLKSIYKKLNINSKAELISILLGSSI